MARPCKMMHFETAPASTIRPSRSLYDSPPPTDITTQRCFFQRLLKPFPNQ